MTTHPGWIPSGALPALPSTRWAGLTVALGSGAALLVALGSEWFLGLVPCALCLWERWPYRMALVLGFVALLLPRLHAKAMLAGAGLVFMLAAGLGATHVGVEQGYWPSPLPECAAPKLGQGSIAERLAAMPAHPSKPCDDPTYLIPGLPVSMAAMNTLYALGMTGFVAIFLWRTRKEEF